MQRMTILAVMAAVTTLIGGLLPTGAMSQTFPSRQVTIYIPAGPGASTDIEARLYANKLTELMGQSFVVDYKPGAGQTLGPAFVAKSRPDGYTLMALTASFTSAPALYKDLPYDPIRDFAPISLMSKRSSVIAAHPSVPYNNVREYVSYTRANSGQVNVATTGAGGAAHLNAARFHSIVGTKVTFVHYKAAANGQTDLLANRVNITFTTLLSALPLIKSGKLKAVGLTNAERTPLLPGIMTAVEQGVDYVNASPFGISAPAGTPAAVLNRLSIELMKVARSPDVAQKLEADGGMMVGSTPKEFGDFLATEIVRWKKLVAETGITLED